LRYWRVFFFMKMAAMINSIIQIWIGLIMEPVSWFHVE
jgi:hypothetical protein